MQAEAATPQSRHVLVKICGLTRRVDAAAARAAGADLLGFIFVPGTPRALDPATVAWVRAFAGTGTVGVFRDAPLADVLAVRRRLSLDWVQLHGDEPDSYLDQLGPFVLRRMPVAHGVDWDRVLDLSSRCLPLLDPGAGDGKPVAWDALAPPPEGAHFGVAGGLTPTNVGEVVAKLRPALVDVASGVERATGVKDAGKVAAFVAAARAALGRA